MLNSFHQSIFNRYGIVPDPKKTPSYLELPQAKPLYKETGMTQNDIVREHGEWCRIRCANPQYAEEIRNHLASLED